MSDIPVWFYKLLDEAKFLSRLAAKPSCRGRSIPARLRAMSALLGSHHHSRNLIQDISRELDCIASELEKPV